MALIREVETAEVAWLHCPQKRQRRETSQSEAIAGEIIPAYGGGTHRPGDSGVSKVSILCLG